MEDSGSYERSPEVPGLIPGWTSHVPREGLPWGCRSCGPLKMAPTAEPTLCTTGCIFQIKIITADNPEVRLIHDHKPSSSILTNWLCILSETPCTTKTLPGYSQHVSTTELYRAISTGDGHIPSIYGHFMARLAVTHPGLPGVLLHSVKLRT
jgi:hypothetical protein